MNCFVKRFVWAGMLKGVDGAGGQGMKNVKLEVDGRTLTITVDLGINHGRSRSGKSVIVGTTEGTATVKDADGKAVCVGLNVYRKA